MQRFILFIFMVCALSSHAQKKAPVNKPVADSSAAIAAPAPVDTLDPTEAKIKADRKFAVYNKQNKGKVDNKKKYCIQLVTDSAVHNWCSVDSTIKGPETTKVLFSKLVGDTNYVLVFIDAFTKVPDKVECEAGKETKLVYFRWNTRTNKSIAKIRTINSCLRAITNMTKENIAEWDGSAPLVLNYHKGGTKFVEVKFDPAQFLLGFQSTDTEK
jgi:hypothetical protein